MIWRLLLAEEGMLTALRNLRECLLAYTNAGDYTVNTSKTEVERIKTKLFILQSVRKGDSQDHWEEDKKPNG